MHPSVYRIDCLRSLLGRVLHGRDFLFLHLVLSALGDLGGTAAVGHFLVCCNVEGDEQE